MGLESTQAHMSNLGRSELITGRVMEVDDIIAAYDAVTPADVQALSRQMFDFSQVSLSAVGRVAAPEEYQRLLQ